VWKAYRQAYAHLAEFVKLLRSDGVEISNLDLGGGLGIKYYEENTPTPSDYGAMVQEILGGLGCSFSFEPGRIISGDSGILVSKVIYLKETASKTFCIVDAAMNDFIRPTLYEAYHDILKVDEPKRHDVTKIFQIVGPICESGDYFAKNRELPKINQGDLIALKTVGAYGAVMSSCYNSRPLIPEVMVRNDQYSIIRERETIKDIIKKEKIPQWM
jgi:Diaminopimelate decarboxylase